MYSCRSQELVLLSYSADPSTCVITTLRKIAAGLSLHKVQEEGEQELDQSIPHTTQVCPVAHTHFIEE